MDLGKQFKDFLISGFMSLSKAEQSMLKDIINEADPDSKQEHQVRKDHIKLLSPKRFYEILERAEEKQLEKYAEKFALLREQRGLANSDRSFRNREISDMTGQNTDFSFKTDNGLFAFAESVKISINDDGTRLLQFYINERKHPTIRNHAHLLAQLGAFEFMEGHLRYAYSIQQFVGIDRSTPYEVSLKFKAFVNAEGEKPFASNDETERIHHKRDLLSSMDKNTYTLGSSDFRRNG